MPEWLRGLCVFGCAVLAIAAIVAITVITGGTAAPVLVGAAVGAGISGSVSAIGQLCSTGTINFGQWLTDVAFGAISGAFGGTALNLLGMTISSGGIGFIGSVAEDLVAGRSIDLKSAALSASLGCIIGLLGGAGAQNGKLSELKKFTARLKVCEKKNIVNKYLKQTLKGLERETSILVFSANKAILRGIPYSIGSNIISCLFKENWA